MFAHHFFYTYLDGMAVDSYLWSMHGFTMSEQLFASIIGNSIAYVACVVLSAGIGIVFIQVLWSKLRRGGFSVEQIDALVVCKGEPFALSALSTWHYAFWLATIALMSTSMALISIVAPGSLQIESLEFSFPAACTVQTVSLETSNIGTYYTITGNSSSSFIFEGSFSRGPRRGLRDLQPESSLVVHRCNSPIPAQPRPHASTSSSSMRLLRAARRSIRAII